MPAKPLSPEQTSDSVRLKAIFESKKRELGITQDSLTAACGWESQGTVSQYMNGKIPLNLKSALKFARALRCSVSDFSPRLAHELPSDLPSSAIAPAVYGQGAGGVEPSNVAPGPAISRQRVPLISSVQAGDFTTVVDNLHPGDAERWIDVTVPVNRYTFALRVSGDSMEPDFPAGMILVVEPEMEANPGDFIIAKNGSEEATFKQLVKDGGDWWLKPLNPRYPLKPLEGCTIVGVVRQVVRTFR